MTTRSMYLSGLVRTLLMLSVICLAATYTSIATAAQGCGHGFHRGAYGRCVLNAPGPGATPAPYHRGCWRNARGNLRCYR